MTMHKGIAKAFIYVARYLKLMSFSFMVLSILSCASKFQRQGSAQSKSDRTVWKIYYPKNIKINYGREKNNKDELQQLLFRARWN